MARVLCLFLVLFAFVKNGTVSAQTNFYKRIKIIKDGQSMTVNDDGHYITFWGNCLYDSDSNGFGSGHDKMSYIKTENNISTYYGNGYYGYGYCYVSSDKSRINLKVNDHIYVYVKCVPTSNIPLRKSANEAPASMPVGVSSNSQNSGFSSNGSASKLVRKTCSGCHGTGKGFEEIVYRPDYTGKQNDEYCSKCGKWGSPHYHHARSCSVCNGKGYTEN